MLLADNEPAYRTWKDGINDPPEVLADGYPPPGGWWFEYLLRCLYAMPEPDRSAP